MAPPNGPCCGSYERQFVKDERLICSQLHTSKLTHVWPLRKNCLHLCFFPTRIEMKTNDPRFLFFLFLIHGRNFPRGIMSPQGSGYWVFPAAHLDYVRAISQSQYQVMVVHEILWKSISHKSWNTVELQKWQIKQTAWFPSPDLTWSHDGEPVVKKHQSFDATFLVRII